MLCSCAVEPRHVTEQSRRGRIAEVCLKSQPQSGARTTSCTGEGPGVFPSEFGPRLEAHLIAHQPHCCASLHDLAANLSSLQIWASYCDAACLQESGSAAGEPAICTSAARPQRCVDVHVHQPLHLPIVGDKGRDSQSGRPASLVSAPARVRRMQAGACKPAAYAVRMTDINDLQTSRHVASQTVSAAVCGRSAQQVQHVRDAMQTVAVLFAGVWSR